MNVSEYLAQLRGEAIKRAEKRMAGEAVGDVTGIVTDHIRKEIEVAEYVGLPQVAIGTCCGNVCDFCDIFLDKAIALKQLGYSHHLHLTPAREKLFQKALAIYRNDPEEYKTRRKELLMTLRGRGG